MADETWRPIPGWPSHEVSSIGRIKRLKSGRLVSVWISDKGYQKVTLRAGGQKLTVPVHRLVASAFLPNPYLQPVVNHLNGIKRDNRVENLEWCSHQENVRHAIDAGLCDDRINANRGRRWRKTVRAVNAALSDEDVAAIRAEYARGGVRQNHLAELYNTNRRTVGRIIRKETYQ